MRVSSLIIYYLPLFNPPEYGWFAFGLIIYGMFGYRMGLAFRPVAFFIEFFISIGDHRGIMVALVFRLTVFAVGVNMVVGIGEDLIDC